VNGLGCARTRQRHHDNHPGTAAKAGTHPLTVQFTPTQDAAPNGRPPGTQQLTVTIGAGASDRLHGRHHDLRSPASWFFPAFMAIFDHPGPVLAAINGHAIAGGCVIAAACDVRVMSQGKIGLDVVIGPHPGRDHRIPQHTQAAASAGDVRRPDGCATRFGRPGWRYPCWAPERRLDRWPFT
jgi:hypothetical protein